MALFSVSEVAHKIFIEIALAGPSGVSVSSIWKLDNANSTFPSVVQQLVWNVFFDSRHYGKKIVLVGSEDNSLNPSTLTIEKNAFSLEDIFAKSYNRYEVAKAVEIIRICPMEKFEFMVLGITTPKCTLTEANICALRFIAQFRKNGVLLTEVFKHLQKRSLSGLSKNSNHIIKTLEDEGLVVKILERNNHKAVNINRVTLRRFKPWDPSEKENTLAKQGGTLYLEKNFFQFYERLRELMQIISESTGLTKLVLSDVIKLVMEADSKRENSEFRHHRQSVLRDFLIKLWERGESIIEVKNLSTSYIKSKESTKKTRTQSIACCILHTKPIPFKESIHYASILERKQFVQEIREVAKGCIGPKDGYSLYDQVLELIYDSGEKGMRVKDLNYITCAPPKYLYKLVKRIVEVKNSKLVWFKESGESAQAHRRVFYKKFVNKGKKVSSRLEQNKAYLKEVVEYYKILNLQVLLSIMKKYEETANNKKSDRRTILKHVKQLGYRMKDMDGPVQSNTGGKSKLIIWDPKLISPDEKKLMDTFFEIKSDDRFKVNPKYSTKLHNRKINKLSAYNTMSKKNKLKTVVVTNSDNEEDSSAEEQSVLVPRILKKAELRELIIAKKGRDTWTRINQEFFFALQATSSTPQLSLEDLEKEFREKYPYPSYMDRVCKFHCELWERTFGRDTVFDKDNKTEMRDGVLLSRNAVDVSSCWRQMKLKKYFSTFRLSYKRKLLPRNYKTLMEEAEKDITVEQMINQNKEYTLFLSPTAIVNRFTQTLAEMGMLLTVKRDLKTGEVSTLSLKKESVQESEAKSEEGAEDQTGTLVIPTTAAKRSDRETHFLNYDDSRLDLAVKQAVEKKDTVFQYVLLCDPRKASSYFCGGNSVNLSETFRLRSVEDIRNFYSDLKERIRKANLAPDGSASYNVLQVGTFLNPLKWNIEVKKGVTPRSKRPLNLLDHPLSPNKLAKHSAFSKFCTLADLTGVSGVESQLKKLKTGTLSKLASKPKKTIKEFNMFWKWFIENGCSVRKFVEVHGYNCLQYLDKAYEKDRFGKQEEYSLTYIGKIDKLESNDKEFVNYYWHKARSFLVFADDRTGKENDRIENMFEGFNEDKLRVAISILKKDKIVRSAGSLFKDSPSMCARVGSLHRSYLSDLHNLTTCSIGIENIQDAKKWANKMDLAIENEQDYFDFSTDKSISGAEFLAILCKSISSQYNLNFKYLDDELLVVDDERKVKLAKEFKDNDDTLEQDKEKDDFTKAPIIPTKHLSSYQPKFKFIFKQQEAASPKKKFPQAPRKRLKVVVDQTSILKTVRDAGSIGVNASVYQTFNMKPILENQLLIEVPCYDHRRLVALEFIKPWVVFSKGTKLFNRLAKARKSVMDMRVDDDNMSLPSQSSTEDELEENENEALTSGKISLESAVKTGLVVYEIARKWIYCNGAVNTNLKIKYQQAILMNVLESPGASIVAIAEKLKRVLSPIDVEDLAEELINLELLEKRQLTGHSVGSKKKRAVKGTDVVFGLVPVINHIPDKWSSIFE